MEISEYFVYFGIFIMHSRDERFDQIAKGVFFERAKQKGRTRPVFRKSVPRRSAIITPLLHVVLHKSVSHKGMLLVRTHYTTREEQRQESR